MKNNPQVAVMMPVYNGERTLPLAITSLLFQTYPYWKCYIVNDGSTDGTRGYLDSLNDDRFVIIHFENNLGRPFARQAALDIAEGKYLAFLDADDFYHPQKLEKQIEAFDKNKDIDLVSCGMASFDHRLILRTVRSNQFISYEKFVKGKDLFILSRAGSMVKLLEAKNIGYNLSLSYAQDTDFFVRYLDGNAYMNLADAFYYYSEFESVNLKKLIKTYFFNINQIKSNFTGLPKFKYVLIEVFKILYNSFIGLIFGVDRILLKRGKPVDAKEIEYFEMALNLYQNNKKL